MTGWMKDGERLDLLGRPLPPSFELRLVVLRPGDHMGYDPAAWRGALFEVDCGEIDIVFRSGVSGRLGIGSLFWLDGLAPQALHNRGHQPVVLVAVSRRRRVRNGDGAPGSLGGEETQSAS